MRRKEVQRERKAEEMRRQAKMEVNQKRKK